MVLPKRIPIILTGQFCRGLNLDESNKIGCDTPLYPLLKLKSAGTCSLMSQTNKQTMCNLRYFQCSIDSTGRRGTCAFDMWMDRSPSGI